MPLRRNYYYPFPSASPISEYSSSYSALNFAANAFTSLFRLGGMWARSNSSRKFSAISRARQHAGVIALVVVVVLGGEVLLVLLVLLVVVWRLSLVVLVGVWELSVLLVVVVLGVL